MRCTVSRTSKLSWNTHRPISRQITHLCDPSEGDHMFLQSSFSYEERQIQSWRAELFQTGTFPPLLDNEIIYLFLQCQAQTTTKMRAVRTMTKTGTRTAANATSKSRKATINTRWQTSLLRTKQEKIKSEMWRTLAGVRRHRSVSDVWGVCGLTKVRRAFCSRRRGRVTWGG